MKTCKKCHEDKPATAEYFYRDKGTKGGLRNDCKICKGRNRDKWLEEQGTEYKAWTGMKSRCYNKNTTHFERWGGRGIAVCERWKYSFDNFLTDMGRKPSPEHSLDRVDNEKDYTPENCRWATHFQQAQNRRLASTNRSGHHGVGVDKNTGNWLAYITANNKRYHLGSFENKEDAIIARQEAEVKYHNKPDTL